MTNDIICGIALKLSQAFGSEYIVHTEPVVQGFKAPCFCIQHLLTMNEPKIPVRYLQRHSFDVRYFPRCKLNPNKEMHAVARQLSLYLEYILVLDNLVKASKMSYEIQEGHLHFFVDYNIFVKKQTEDGELMETLIHK